MSGLIPALTPTSESSQEFIDTVGVVLMQTLGMDQFSFGLFPDTVVWDAWVYAVQDDANGASQAEKDAVGKFSDYVIKVECATTNDSDGCCMFQTVPDNGGWCLFQAGSKLDTYRLTKEAALDFRENAFGSIGTDYETSAAAFKVDIADPANVEYLDFFKCGSKVNGVFTCHHFQPNWTE